MNDKAMNDMVTNNKVMSNKVMSNKANPFIPIMATVLLQMRQSFSRSMFKFVMLATPIFSGLIFGLIYSDTSDYHMIAFVMIGTATTSMWSTICFSSAGDINRERFMGALEKLFLVPVDFFRIMGAKVIANTILGLFSMIISFGFVSLVFGVTVTLDHPWLFFITALVMVISYGILGLLLSGLLAISRKTTMLMNIIGFPVYILTGAVFPVEILPSGIRWLAYLLSPTYGIKLLRYSIYTSNINEASNSGWIINLSVLIGLTLMYYMLARLFFRYMDNKVRKDATLDLY